MAEPRRGWRRFLLRWGLFLFGLWVAVIVVMSFLENRLVFLPSRADEAWWPPQDPRTTDVWFTSKDGTKLHGWWLAHEAGPAAGACLVAHGNGGNLSHRGRLAADLAVTLNRSVLLFDYPGYGKSEGKPTEQGCYDSAETAYAWLTNEQQVPPAKIILVGESLGGAVAVELATHHDHEALVLTKTFTSLPAAAKVHYPCLPVHTLMSNRFDNLARIGRCKKPVLIAHGTADRVVPFEQGEELFAAANEPKRFVRLEGEDHNDWLTERFYTELKQFLAGAN